MFLQPEMGCRILKKTEGTNMRGDLQQYCEQYIVNRDAVKSTLKMANGYMYPVCANLFLSRGMEARAERLEECRAVLKEKTGIFSNFRSLLQAPVICMLSMTENPEAELEKALAGYEQMKKEFMASDYLVLAALLLPGGEDMAHIVARGKEIYRRMRKEHPFLTSSEDSVYALMMAASEKSDDALMMDMEEGYALLKRRFGAGNPVQAISHMLALQAADPRLNAGRVCELFDEIERIGGKYGKYYELPTLAALAMMEGDLRQVAADIMEADAFLAGQKGYGFFGMGKKMRLMHAAMIVSCARGARSGIDAAVISSTLAMVIAQQAAAAAAAAGAATAVSN